MEEEFLSYLKILIKEIQAPIGTEYVVQAYIIASNLFFFQTLHFKANYIRSKDSRSEEKYVVTTLGKSERWN
jgi:hypothetical protein